MDIVKEYYCRMTYEARLHLDDKLVADVNHMIEEYCANEPMRLDAQMISDIFSFKEDEELHKKTTDYISHFYDGSILTTRTTRINFCDMIRDYLDCELNRMEWEELECEVDSDMTYVDKTV